jgi:hypothetical protein
MPPKISPFWEGYINALSDVGFSYSAIRKQCKEKGFSVSDKGINGVLNRNKNADPSAAGFSGEARKKHPAPKRTPAVVKKVRSLVLQENPPTQKAIASRVHVSKSTVNRIISQDLKLELRHKAKVHVLRPRHIAERRTNCRRLYERHLAADKWKFVVTLDEAWVYLSDCDKKRAVFYRSRDSQDRSDWVRECKESFPRGFMVVAGYSYNGKLPIRRIEPNAKINAAYYQEKVLEPMYRVDIPSLYGSDTRKVGIHQDKASSHTARSTVAYMDRLAAETGIRAIPFHEIPVKSPDASPMDFCGFGLLKRAIGNRRPRTLDGLWKVCQEEWERIDLAVLRRSLMQWKLRCRAIVRRQGLQIEHNRWWRRGFT